MQHFRRLLSSNTILCLVSVLYFLKQKNIVAFVGLLFSKSRKLFQFKETEESIHRVWLFILRAYHDLSKYVFHYSETDGPLLTEFRSVILNFSEPEVNWIEVKSKRLIHTRFRLVSVNGV